MAKITGLQPGSFSSNSSARLTRIAGGLGGIGLISFVLLALLVLWLASPARAAQNDGGRNGQMVSASADPAPGGIDLVYRAPDRGVFTLTQACADHIAVYVEAGGMGRMSQRLTYGTSGCTYFHPGVVLKRGERLRCVNKSGLSQSCTIMGIYDAAAATVPRPKVVDTRS